MNLCDFCVHYNRKYKNCVMIRDFIRPIGHRVYCCNFFIQYSTQFAEITFSSLDSNVIIGLVNSLPLKLERNKNQINYQL